MAVTELIYKVFNNSCRHNI